MLGVSGHNNISLRFSQLIVTQDDNFGQRVAAPGAINGATLSGATDNGKKYELPLVIVPDEFSPRFPRNTFPSRRLAHVHRPIDRCISPGADALSSFRAANARRAFEIKNPAAPVQ